MAVLVATADRQLQKVERRALGREQRARIAFDSPAPPGRGAQRWPSATSQVRLTVGSSATQRGFGPGRTTDHGGFAPRMRARQRRPGHQGGGQVATAQVFLPGAGHIGAGEGGNRFFESSQNRG